MTFISLFSKLALPVSLLAYANVSPSSMVTTAVVTTAASSDSTLSIPIEVLNKGGRTVAVVEKEIIIPKGYVYLRHELALVSAFPMEGVEQSGNWIVGPNNSWSVYAKLEVGNRQPERIVVRASASPGSKNAEIGAQAMLSVELRKQGRAN